jgi:HPt (histidine-containing phosphotransfer) domain-containing protein
MDAEKVTFDLNEVIEQTGLEVDEYLEIYELYQESFAELMQDLEKSLADRNDEAVMHAAHTLKGASANIGFIHIADLAKSIQDDPGNFEMVGETVPKLWSTYQELNREVEAIAQAQQV